MKGSKKKFDAVSCTDSESGKSKPSHDYYFSSSQSSLIPCLRVQDVVDMVPLVSGHYRYNRLFDVPDDESSHCLDENSLIESLY